MVRGTKAAGALALLAQLASTGPAHAQEPEPRATSAPTTKATAAPAAAASATPTATPTAAPKSAPTDPPPEGADSPEERAQDLRDKAAHIQALIEEALDTNVDLTSLFDIALDDALAIELEIFRLRAIVEAASEKKAGTGGTTEQPWKTDGAATANSPPDDAPAASASASASAPPPPPPPPPEVPEPALWQARLALDRARLSFYELSSERRDALIATHEERVREASREQSTVRLSAAERKASEAEDDRRRAVESARRARTEAARLVAEEQARLATIARKQAELDVDWIRASKLRAERSEKVLGFGRRVREALEAAERGTAETDIDKLHDELRVTLRAARAELAATLDLRAAGGQDIPNPGEDRLASLPIDVDHGGVDETRARLLEAARELETRHLADLDQLASQLYGEAVGLNEQRLALLPHLSASKRRDVLGVSPAGFEQARAEAFQVSLISRYHATAVVRWIETLLGRGDRVATAYTSTTLLLKFLLALGLFLGWRKQAPRSLALIEERVRDDERRRRAALGTSLPSRIVRLLIRIRGALEWLVFASVALWILPEGASDVLEVRIAETLVFWILGGSLAVSLVDHLASEREGERLRDASKTSARLRLRTLNVVSKFVVTLGLVLGLSEQLVGRGTIHAWVGLVGWTVAIPLAIAIISWWHTTIFERIAALRRSDALSRWILGTRTSKLRLAGALLGAGLLGTRATYRFASAALGKLDLTRRLLAYLFRRDLSKRGREREVALAPLAPEAYAALSPDLASTEWVESEVDPQVTKIVRLIANPGGAVIAVVGERGSGKTSVLDRIANDSEDVVVVHCPYGGLDKFAPEFLSALGADPTESLESAAANFDDHERAAAILIDDAHRLVMPVMGGLRAFDRVVRLARQHCRHVAWVFAMDEVIWRFFERSRGARPLFDDVVLLEAWTEEEITDLLGRRCSSLGLVPNYDGLLVREEGTELSDEEHEEGLSRTQAGYHRLLWDFASGNPGVALHHFREVLGQDETGEAHVRVFSAPDARPLESLPDEAAFVLRALIQLEAPRFDDLCRATNLPERRVDDVIRFAQVRGIVEADGDRFRIGWTWFRTVTRFLERRHLWRGRA